EYVLRSDYEKYDKRTRSVSRMRPVCGESLLTLDGDPWRRERRLVQPAFHPQRVAAFAPLMAEATAATLSRWKSHAETGEPLDIASEMMRLTCEIAARCLFSADVSRELRTVEEAATVVLEHCLRRMQQIVALPERLWP